MSDFGDFIKKKRLSNQLTLRQFCLENGYDAGNHSKLERGLLLPPEGEKLERLAAALGIKLTKPKNCFDTQKLEEYHALKELAEVERQPLKADIVELKSQLTEKDKKIQTLEALLMETKKDTQYLKSVLGNETGIRLVNRILDRLEGGKE